MNGRQHIVQKIAIIRTALKQHGYSLRKQPRQAVWTIQVSSTKQYRLTYQSSPIALWFLHPVDGDRIRQEVLSIIQNTLNQQPIDPSEKVL
ncbi:hypothetical protein H6F93_22750 [Leptolyngbya sp. FACHB-671]|uniref:hypothetical protein n=1 Tax=Leptolyngbya sp. FACHB-671 TaxID=2692812 RepID=UPI0016875C2E|nr:hypothetical protein [Leptolyngbya sp. FACHB-671]MBD2070296.1 hypothetical protein [Leptolyngbya sp. FACHB-671]